VAQSRGWHIRRLLTISHTGRGRKSIACREPPLSPVPYPRRVGYDLANRGPWVETSPC
jgi:hypothetical protein